MLRRGRFSLAIALFLATVLGASGAPDKQADSLLKSKKYGSARKRLLQVASENSGSTKSMAARYQAAFCLFMMNDNELFEQEAQAFLRDYPSARPWMRENARMNLAIAAVREQRWAEARVRLTSYLTDYPNSNRAPEAAYQAAACLFGLQQYDAFRQEAESLLRRFPKAKQAVAARFDCARAHYRQGRFTEARAALQSFAAAYPTAPQSVDARHLALQCLYQTRQYAAFKQEARSFLIKGPLCELREEQQQSLRLELALLAARQEKWRESADQSYMLLASKPGSVRVRLSALITHARACINLVEKAKNPADQVAARQLERRAKKMLEEVRSEAGRALADKRQSTTDTQSISNLLLEAYFYSKDYAGLNVEAEKMSASHPRSSKPWAQAMFWRGLAKVNMRPSDLPGAVKLLNEILASGYADSNAEDHLPTTVHYWLAAIAETRGDKAEVERLVRLVREQSPEGASKRMVLDRFKSRRSDVQK